MIVRYVLLSAFVGLIKIWQRSCYHRFDICRGNIQSLEAWYCLRDQFLTTVCVVSIESTVLGKVNAIKDI